MGGCQFLPPSAIVTVEKPAPLAQLDRASGYEPEGREFESLRAHHLSHVFNHLRALRANARRSLCSLSANCPCSLSEVRFDGIAMTFSFAVFKYSWVRRSA